MLEKLKSLPPSRVAEVEDFIDFLKAREERTRDEASRRLGDAFAKLDAWYSSSRESMSIGV